MTKEQKVEAYSMYLDGETYETIGKKFGVSKQYIGSLFLNIPRERVIYKKIVYPNIRRCMKNKGLTFTDLASICGISPRTILAILKGGVDCKLSNAIKIASAFGMTVEFAFEKEEVETNSNVEEVKE